MANEKKPSIYVDRGTIGSSDELDEYGVWVKSEPQDLNSESIEVPEASDLSGEPFGSDESMDLSISDIDKLPDFDSLQSEMAGEIYGVTTGKLPDDTPPMDTAFEDTALNEDFDLPDIEIEEASDTAAFAPGDFPVPSEDFRDESAAEAESESSEGFTEVSMDDFIGTLESEPEVEFEEPVEEPLQAPVEIETPIEDETPMENERPEENEPPAAAPVVQQDLSTQLLMKIAEELSSIRVELSSLKKEFSTIKVSAQNEEAGETAFFGEEDDEKIALTGDELNNILNTADFTEEAGADATVDLSDDLNIQETEAVQDAVAEPSSVEPGSEEIVSQEPAFEEIVSDADFEDVSVPEEPAPEESVSGEIGLDEVGLDETSLDETGKDILQDLDLDISLDETDLDELGGEVKEDISLPEEFTLSEDLVLPGEMNPIEEVVPEEEALPEFDSNENDELKELRENGAEPMTFAPEAEDTDYLIGDPLAESAGEENSAAIEDFPAEAPLPEAEGEVSEDVSFDSSINLADETIDLSEAVIDEPDLSQEIQDNPIEEPSLDDISISLDLSELGSDELGTTDELSADELGSNEPGIVDFTEQEETIELPEVSEVVEEETEPLEIDSETPDFAADLSLIPEGFVEAPDDSGQMPGEGDDNAVSLNELDNLGLADELPETAEIEAAENAPGEPEKTGEIPSNLKEELRTVLSYMDQLLESLPDEKIEEFAKSEFYDTYKKLFKELGLV